MDPGYFDMDREENPYVRANLLSKIFFWYTKDIFQKGRQGQLSITDLYECMETQRAAPRGDVMADVWQNQLMQKDRGKKPSLLKCIFKVHGLKFTIVNIIFALIDCALRLAVPLCLEGLISYFSTDSTVTVNEAYLYAFGVVFCMVFAAGIMHPLLLWLFHISLKVRVACSSLLYRKLLRLDLTTGGKASEGLTGYIINLLTTDAQRLDLAFVFMTDLIRTPIESSIIIFLMYRQIGVATLIGVAFLLLFIPLQGYLGRVSGQLRRKTAVRTDNRIRLMNEVIQSIEAVKMFVWEKAFARIIGNSRRKEMNVIKKISWLRAVMISCVKLNTKIAIFLSLLAFIAFGENLTAAKVFVIFSYYEMLKLTLVDFLPMAITFTIEAYVSVKRFQEFLLLPEVENQDGVDLKSIDDRGIKSNGVFEKLGNGLQAHIKSENNLELYQNKPEVLASMENYSAFWKNVEEIDKKVVALKDINLLIKPRSLTMIVGTVGSGKSTILQALLRELSPSAGTLSLATAVAYAAQEPWLFDASIRQNIIFGQDMDMRRYKQVIKCCQLKRDLEILPYGDKTVVGEKGSSLSGGQRARVSLARCVYRRASLYLLDDPLAAVDARVSAALLDDCITSFLSGSAVVLVTHHAHEAYRADNVVLVKNGEIAAQGTFDELKKNVPEFVKLLEAGKKEKTEEPKEIEYEKKESMEQMLRLNRTMSEASQLSFNMDLDNNLSPTYQGEAQKKGAVSNSVYMSYIRSGGSKWSMLLLFALFMCAQFFISSADVWLKEWVNMEEANTAAMEKLYTNNDTSVLPINATNIEVDYSALAANKLGLTREQNIYIYAGILGICIFFTLNKLVVFYNTCIKASIKLHDTMFRGVTSAPMWFFHHNPSGRILNRFAKDMGQVDTLLPGALVDCLGFFLEVVAILIVVCLANWWLLLPTAVVAFLLYSLRELFLNVSRELKRTEAIARTQALNYAASTVNGLTTIRSSGDKQITLAREFDKQQDLHSSAWTLVLTSNRAFGFWMDMVCCLYLACVTFSFFLFAGNASMGGNVGLAITQVIGLVGMCQFGMRQTAEVENQMTSVERILEYSNLPSEKPMETDEVALKRDHPTLDFAKWPEKGEVIFKNVSLEYEKPPKQEAEPMKDKSEPMKDKSESMKDKSERVLAIRDVSFRIAPAEKVAVVGRTGAGKSSLIAALFRLSNTEGSVLVDGVDSSTAGLWAWRARLGALPQRPALFAASLRDNLDPHQVFTDAQIWDALEQVELKRWVGSLSAGLNTRVGDGGGSLSIGQRQLVCLARAALCHARVLLLDEATANVDSETDKQIQATIRSRFAQCSVLTIAHRLHTVMDYDRVIVMDQGRVVEVGHPYELLTKPKAHEVRTGTVLTKNLTIPENEVTDYPEGGVFKTLVEQTGRDTATMLYDMAKQSYKRMEEQKKNS